MYLQDLICNTFCAEENSRINHFDGAAFRSDVLFSLFILSSLMSHNNVIIIISICKKCALE